MSIFKWPLPNIAPGETDPEKRVDGDRIMDNFETLAAAHRPRALGSNAVDGNTNGSSITTQCNITVKTDQGELGLLFLNDWVIVEDTNGNVWNLQNTLANDELSFSVTHLISGSTPGDYSDAGFINGLEIMINPGRMVLGKNQLGLSGSHAQKITGSDVETSSADTAKIGTALPAVQTQIDVEHEAGGGHSADIISVSNIAPDALLYENDANLVFGKMDYDSEQNGRPDGWKDYNTPTTVERSTTQVKEDTYSAKIVASQPSDGIENNPNENPIDPDLFKGNSLALSAWVYCATNNTVKLEIYDGVGVSTSSAGGTAGSWVPLYISRDIDAAATEITPRIYATQATTFYVDAAMFCLGELPAGFTPHVNEVMYARIAEASLTNHCPNAQFDEWSSGSSVPPDWWESTGVLAVGAGPANFLFGARSADVTLAIGETFYVDIPIYLDFRGRDVYFNAYIKLIAATNKLRMEVNDGVDDTPIDIVPAAGWQRRGIKHTVNAAATQLRISFENQDGGSIQVYIDGVMLTADSAPIGYKPQTVYKPFERVFGLAGSVSAGELESAGGVTTEVPVSFSGLIQSLFIKQGTPVGVGTTNTYTLYKNTVQDANYSVALINTEDAGSDGVAVADAAAVAPGDTIGVRVAVAGGVPGSNAVAVVKGITWS